MRQIKQLKCINCKHQSNIKLDACNYQLFHCKMEHYMVKCQACGWIFSLKNEKNIPSSCPKCPCIFFLEKPPKEPIPENCKMPNQVGIEHKKQFKARFHNHPYFGHTPLKKDL